MNPLLPIFILMIVALDAIVGTGPGGMFMDKVHTLERMRTTALLPKIANRLPQVQWEAKGAQDAQVQAMQRVHEILTRDNLATFSADVEVRIRAEFEDLVVGDAISIHPTTNSQ